ncbi:MAG TPA: hypothetical protein DCQ30_10910 [Acidimicrobiaceae bacterium]|nr:hypothetical protein [Acidimicrobiaceae bacterium]
MAENHDRRRVRRAPTEPWPGKYTIDDDPLAGWHECRLLDISVLGLGLELFGPVHPNLVDRPLVVHVDVAGGQALSLRFAGTVRNLIPGRFGGVRVGVEFTDLSDGERSALAVMEHLNLSW